MDYHPAAGPDEGGRESGRGSTSPSHENGEQDDNDRSRLRITLQKNRTPQRYPSEHNGGEPRNGQTAPTLATIPMQDLPGRAGRGS
jgi:hypothetical protein